MCGIVGIISKNGSPVTTERMESASICLAHRGPDDHGIWISSDRKMGLGHRRLSILDLSRLAAQPMHYLDRYFIIHNGEIYNYQEIRTNLAAKGYVFSSSSDTEVIVAAYDAYGKDCLTQFDGMFAFAIWDEKDKKLFAARDRLGEKPFFFSDTAEGFFFASEMKTLWQLGVPKETEPSMLYNFLTIGYTSNPGDPTETFFRNISKLPAASYLTWSESEKQPELIKYWHIDPAAGAAQDPAEAIEKFREIFTRSVSRRLRSDVPVGTSLSGGLDSSAIIAFANGLPAEHYSHECFTAVFEGFEKNEFAHASKVATQYGLKHHVVRIDEQQIVPLMDEVMFHQEEPIGSASALAQFMVYRAARQQGVRVLLDGQGADEILAGYHKYYKWYWQELYRKGGLKKSGELAGSIQAGSREKFGWRNKAAAMFPEFAAGIAEGRKARSAARSPGLDPEFVFANKRQLHYTMPSSFDLDGALFFNTFTYGLEELLRYADRNSMASGTEVRLPFLSHELVEFLFSMPSSLKIREGWTKWLLRKSVEDKLPEDIVWRKDKTGFEPPQKAWMELASVQEAMQEGKKKLVQAGILSKEVLQKKIKPHNSYAAYSWDWKYWTASYLV
jgi:asparagine synthase (glutamine-hydrolysing)